jgi:hypothetical protein
MRKGAVPFPLSATRQFGGVGNRSTSPKGSKKKNPTEAGLSDSEVSETYRAMTRDARPGSRPLASAGQGRWRDRRTVNLHGSSSDERILQTPLELAGTDNTASWLALRGVHGPRAPNDGRARRG